ncbi:hypothetical protein L3V59_35115 [Burkholderia aenigmatica]|uniref:hypothetical protein n=1 Tax=Burkholderia aenigmatica TaxID=2015348 RepID=UPI001F1CF415|nr:hypothetical protein [Burkholderia aenigmatica]UKD17202.1 hypothetical protein L3V59_35115 [Burkholderia aenigmatica]
MIPTINGASLSAFHAHPGNRRLLAPQRPTVGVFLQMRFHEGDMCVPAGQAEWVGFGFAGRAIKPQPRCADTASGMRLARSPHDAGWGNRPFRAGSGGFA